MTAAEVEPTWRTTIYGVVRPPGGRRVLLLPPVSLERRVWFSEMGDVARLFRERHGVDVVILGCLGHVDDDGHRHREALYALEPRDPAWTAPAEGRWLERRGVDRLGGNVADLLPGASEDAAPVLRGALEATLAEAAGAPEPPGRNPWTRPGWFAGAVTWIEETLAAQGLAQAGPVEQLKSWSISCVLRVPADQGIDYFKAVPPLFGGEPSITRALAERFPRHVPAVLGIDVARRWMLVADAGAPLRGNYDLGLWEQLLRTLAQMQRAFAAPREPRMSASEANALLALGAVDRRLHVLAGQIDPLLAEAAQLDPSAEEPAARLRPLASRLQDLCAELAEAEVPPTLVHGDLHAGNVGVRDGEPVIFDWTDTCLAHPFQDYVTLVTDDPKSALFPSYDRLRDVYLEAWTDCAPARRLRDLFELGKTLGGLHQAVSYQQIMRSVEPAACREWSGALAYWLRFVLQRVEGRTGGAAPDRPD